MRESFSTFIRQQKLKYVKQNKKDLAKRRILNMTSVVKVYSRGTIATAITTMTLIPIQPISYHNQMAVTMVTDTQTFKAQYLF